MTPAQSAYYTAAAALKKTPADIETARAQLSKMLKTDREVIERWIAREEAKATK